MDNKRWYLKQNVQLEPLINRWYCWPHLVAPATAAMNIANSHIKIMKSYVAAPQMHAAAVKNPAMRGGPFLDLDGSRLEAVKQLLDKTLKEQAHMIELAQAIKFLNELLLSEAKGYSLESLYEKVPPGLRGYVELTYDINNSPAIRFIEALLYGSPYYDKSRQSLSLSPAESDHRSFVFSTPRLEEDGTLTLPIPFDHPAVDELFRMRRINQPLGYAREMLGLEGEQPLLQSLLTEQAPAPCQKYDGDAVRIRYFGHACIQIESNAVTIMTDPVISSSQFNNDGIRRLGFSDLPDTIDYVVLTHGHSDHVIMESLLQLRHKIKTIVVPRNGGGALQDPSLRLVFKNTGFRNVVEIRRARIHRV